jgi:NitT/TauT family transport system ATP-binding protein
MLNVDNLSFNYQTKKILNNLSFQIDKGEIVSLIGLSGSGKTTLFKLLTGLLQPVHGTITINHLRIPEGTKHVSCMMQEDLLLPWRTVLKNMTLLSEFGSKALADISEAKALLEEVGLHDYGEMYPDQLSGGMKQRVSLARALLQKRPLLLLDEPFGSLDIWHREQMYKLLRQAQQRHETTLLMVTHDFRDALFLSDHIFLLSNGTLSQKWKITPALRSDPRSWGILIEEMRCALIKNSP